MNPWIIALNHFTIITGVIALIRFKRISNIFYPFIFFIWLGLANDLLSLTFILNKRSNMISSNIYIILEFLLLLWFFYKWNMQSLKIYILLFIAGLVIWGVDNFIINSISQNNSVFRVFYSFVIVFLSISEISKFVVFQNVQLYKNPVFLLCISFLFYYTFKTIFESYNLFNLDFGRTILHKILLLYSVINFITYLLYTVAILCMPQKQKYLLLY